MEASGRQRRYAAAGSVVLLAGALGYIGLVDPHNSNSLYPPCLFKLLTGWNCPACGGLRMIHDLLHGELAASINDNVFLLVGVPVLASWVLLRRRHVRLGAPDTGDDCCGGRGDRVDGAAQPARLPVSADDQRIAAPTRGLVGWAARGGVDRCADPAVPALPPSRLC